MAEQAVVLKQFLQGYSLEWMISAQEDNTACIKIEAENKQYMPDEQSTFTFSVPKTAGIKIVVSMENGIEDLSEKLENFASFETSFASNGVVYTEMADEEAGEY